MIYYGQYLEKYNQHAREKYRGHRFFQDCVNFCERWDQASFDPNYPDLPLIFFKPMLEEVFVGKSGARGICITNKCIKLCHARAARAGAHSDGGNAAVRVARA